MSDQRERLAKIIGTYDGEAAQRNALEAADRLLAAGVTLPPEPPRLVTEEMLNEASKIRGGSQRYWTIELEGASALVESALRKQIAAHGVRGHNGGHYVQLPSGGWITEADALALFGLVPS